MKNLLELLKVKSLITLIVFIVFAILSLNGTLDQAMVMTVITAVATYYFTKQKEI